MARERQKGASELLADLKRELSGVKLSLSIVGEHSQASKGLVERRASLIEKIGQLEREIEDKEV